MPNNKKNNNNSENKNKQNANGKGKNKSNAASSGAKGAADGAKNAAKNAAGDAAGKAGEAKDGGGNGASDGGQGGISDNGVKAGPGKSGKGGAGGKAGGKSGGGKGGGKKDALKDKAKKGAANGAKNIGKDIGKAALGQMGKAAKSDGDIGNGSGSGSPDNDQALGDQAAGNMGSAAKNTAGKAAKKVTDKSKEVIKKAGKKAFQAAGKAILSNPIVLLVVVIIIICVITVLLVVILFNSLGFGNLTSHFSVTESTRLETVREKVEKNFAETHDETDAAITACINDTVDELDTYVESLNDSSDTNITYVSEIDKKNVKIDWSDASTYSDPVTYVMYYGLTFSGGWNTADSRVADWIETNGIIKYSLTQEVTNLTTGEEVDVSDEADDSSFKKKYDYEVSMSYTLYFDDDDKTASASRYISGATNENISDSAVDSIEILDDGGFYDSGAWGKVKSVIKFIWYIFKNKLPKLNNTAVENDINWNLLTTSATGTTNSSGTIDTDCLSADAEEVYNWLLEQGFSAAGAAGICGNISQESGFSSTSLNPYGYYGICQWGDDRLTDLKTYASDNGLDYTTLNAQLQFMVYEMQGSFYSELLSYLQTTDDPEMAAQEFCARYERPTAKEEDISKAGYARYSGTLYPEYTGKVYQHLQYRIDKATTYYSQYGGNSSTLTLGNSKIITYAKQYEGTPYKAGGNSLTKGICDNRFVWHVLKDTGYYTKSVRTSKQWQNEGTEVSETSMQAGDLICYEKEGGRYHVAFYIDETTIIHVTKEDGVVVTEFDNNKKLLEYHGGIVTVRRFTSTADTENTSSGAEVAWSVVNGEIVDADLDTVSTTYTGSSIIECAMQYVGNPYVYGGNSLTNGIDCSHFVWQILKMLGYYTGSYTSSSGWRTLGTEVSASDVQAGDVLCYDGHVAFYVDETSIVHARGAAYGIELTTDIDPLTYHGGVITIRRFTGTSSSDSSDSSDSLDSSSSKSSSSKSKSSKSKSSSSDSD